mmetsp:Transcript_6976/g.8691  ORF Transcript_6976/g.8691 Transcript_6976/m.8691 type:complete len:192 (+) Transcript_6976:72-647(+)
MSLVCLGLIGKNNEPLYLRDFITGDKKLDISSNVIEDTLFDFVAAGVQASHSSPFQCSLRHQFVLHSSVDRFEELTGPTVGNRWRTPGAVGCDAMWVGLLCPVEELRVYGYLTNTGIKILAAIQDTFVLGQHQQQARESELKSFFASIHHLFVEHTLNPFTKPDSKIISKRFDDGVKNYVTAFNRQNNIAD